MKTTRRGLFGILAALGASGAAAKAGISIVDDTEVDAARGEIELLGPNPGFVGLGDATQYRQEYWREYVRQTGFGPYMGFDKS